MTTYTWLTGGSSYAGLPPSGSLTPVVLDIPAGGIVKRFQVRQTGFLLCESAQDVTTLAGVLWTHLVAWDGSDTTGRKIFQASIGLQSTVACLYDSETSQRIYTQTWEHGDETLRVNQPCSYGKHTDPGPHTISYYPRLFTVGGYSSSVQFGYAQYQFAALYETLP